MKNNKKFVAQTASLRKRQQLKKVVRQIQQEVQSRGGIDEKDLDRRIREYRRVKYAKTSAISR